MQSQPLKRKAQVLSVYCTGVICFCSYYLIPPQSKGICKRRFEVHNLGNSYCIFSLLAHMYYKLYGLGSRLRNWDSVHEELSLSPAARGAGSSQGLPGGPSTVPWPPAEHTWAFPLCALRPASLGQLLKMQKVSGSRVPSVHIQPCQRQKGREGNGDWGSGKGRGSQNPSGVLRG